MIDKPLSYCMRHGWIWVEGPCEYCARMYKQETERLQ